MDDKFLKPVIASMSDEVVLSIEDIKEQASKKLPTTARGKISYPHTKYLYVS
jgi:hypothetical protein